MKRWSQAVRAALSVFLIGWLVYLWQLGLPSPSRPPGPQEYSSFTAGLDGERIVIRNTGGEVLTDCEIQFTAGLDVPSGEGTYTGTRQYPRWEPGQAQEIGISTSQGPTGVLWVRFTGRASSPEKGWGYWRLEYLPRPADVAR